MTGGGGRTPYDPHFVGVERNSDCKTLDGFSGPCAFSRLHGHRHTTFELVRALSKRPVPLLRASVSPSPSATLVHPCAAAIQPLIPPPEHLSPCTRTPAEKQLDQTEVLVTCLTSWCPTCSPFSQWHTSVVQPGTWVNATVWLRFLGWARNLGALDNEAKPFTLSRGAPLLSRGREDMTLHKHSVYAIVA